MLQIKKAFIWGPENCNSGDTDLSSNPNVLLDELKTKEFYKEKGGTSYKLF